MVHVNLENLINKFELKEYEEKVKKVNEVIKTKSGPGNDFLGWVEHPLNYNKEEFELIKKSAEEIRNNYEVLVVCGIGGSYLGARAAIEAINGLKDQNKLEIIFLGQTFSSTYIAQVLNYLENKNFAINVISKSGTTTETSISFRLVKDLLIRKVGKEKANKAIYATTDKEKGALKKEATQEGYVTFTLPSDIGGRYSVLTAVGLLPIACAGIDIDEMMAGALKAYYDLDNDNIYENKCYQYAVARDYLYRHGKSVEMFVTYEPQYTQIGEWFKQLFGESEGKEHKGLFPASATFSTDLHSLGQFVQEGSPILFETVMYVKHPTLEVKVPHSEDNLDGLNYLENKTLEFVNEKAFLGTLDAHVTDGKVDNIILELPKLDAYELGYLFYFFMKTCAMSAYLLDINPFNQPGVEVYKKNMFHLLGKPGF